MARDNKRQQVLDKNKMVKAKACAFCKKEVKGLDYKDVNLLRKFVSDRGKD